MTYSKILVILDRSAQDEAVFQTAVEEAQHHQAKLLLFHCLPVHPIEEFDYSDIYVGNILGFSQAMQRYLEQETAETQSWLSGWSNQAEALGLTVTSDWKVGDFSRNIAHAAKEWKADLLILGHHTGLSLREFFLGSVPNYLIQRVSCHVLVVPHHDM